MIILHFLLNIKYIRFTSNEKIKGFLEDIMNLATTFIIGSFGFKKINDFIHSKKKDTHVNKNNKHNTLDNIIEDKINSHSQKEIAHTYRLGKFKSSRKILNKQELSKVYDKFIKSIPQLDINVEKKKKEYYFNYKKEEIILNNDNHYLLFQLFLKPYKKYRLNINFEIDDIHYIHYLFNSSTRKSFKLITEKNTNKVELITNIVSCENTNMYSPTEFYIMFNKTYSLLQIKNLKFEINELKNTHDFKITILKNNHHINIY